MLIEKIKNDEQGYSLYPEKRQRQREAVKVSRVYSALIELTYIFQ